MTSIDPHTSLFNQVSQFKPKIIDDSKSFKDTLLEAKNRSNQFADNEDIELSIKLDLPGNIHYDFSSFSKVTNNSIADA